ncbi:MAG: hypothetical protein CUN55_20305 [Phototrophicales bacterium]|nr:MAG: hypothetical protein CUN55_20305 [Phototrophicales bacterium]
MVMGQIVEHGNTNNIIQCPAHPYTAELLRSAQLNLEQDINGTNLEPGVSLFGGCIYANYCASARAKCLSQKPETTLVSSEQWVRCNYPQNK